MVTRKPVNDIHAHGCLDCKGRYEDTCEEPTEWAKCSDCRTGRHVRSQLLINNRLPHDCCRTESRLTTKEERTKYRLFQTCPWFICHSCRRTFPFKNPMEKRT